jgi:ribosome biogenesis protein ENP2
MHGFFVDLRLYQKVLFELIKAKAIANPFEFKEYKKQIAQRKIEEKRASRISTIKKLPKVNKTMASDLLQKESVGKSKKTGDILHDDRFKGLFEDPAFEVDKDSREYLLHHPSSAGAVSDKFVPAEDEDEESEDEDKPKLYELKVLFD